MIKSQLEKCDESIMDCYIEISCERVKKGIDKETISFRRFTKAIANLIATHDEIKELLIKAIIEDDRRNGNGHK